MAITPYGEIGAKGFAGSTYAGAFFAGGGEFIMAVSSCEIDEEIAGHEYAGECVNINALYPTFALPQQTYGCGNGYAGGQFAALMYGGGVPCNGFSPTPPEPGGVKSNVEDFCVLDIRCV